MGRGEETHRRGGDTGTEAEIGVRPASKARRGEDFREPPEARK